ncbi:MSMEG_1061 family FMN-dependent PPOX-type flavoprotein [Geodermatophilus normandii]|uniref:Pyridoxamine 5'-phosphate oxidase family protein n=1 Tax=Geodermatophilus normandii TaxID=1137989 RepID=A0A6P0GN67_9ACTN|nr:MSMEG_1061 family FMN-dependent PPOX-type flavoprotein [Geodermatophilus normandii]NEM08815.1 pyridoxamine 5'-phosphate oxidase family protein [Geodermatophilus normandii]
MHDDGADPVLASYRPPSQLVVDKEIDHLDVHCRAFVGLSPFLTLSTADADGWPEISPRGGDPGFVKVLDEHRLVLPDRQGNNRLDSLRKVAVNPRVALLFFVPGVEETLKVFGTAELRAADALDVDLTEFGRAPRSVLVVTVQRAYLQCAKAVMRSGLWDPASRIDRGVLPPFGTMIRDHCRLESPLPDDATLRAELALEL